MHAADPVPGDLPDLRVRLEHEHEHVVVLAEGELDLATVDELRTHVLGLSAGGCPSIVLDLSGLSFADSCQIHLLLELEAAAAIDGFAFAVRVGDATPAQRVLALTRLAGRFRAG